MLQSAHSYAGRINAISNSLFSQKDKNKLGRIGNNLKIIKPCIILPISLTSN